MTRTAQAASLVGAALTLLAASSAAFALDQVRIGSNALISDAPFFIAQQKGYFKEQGIEVEIVQFDAGPKMIAPLGVGQIDVAAGASSAGLYNAVARGINIRVVADKGSTPPGYDYMPILIRKELHASGEVKSIADLKGRKVAEAGEGGSPGSTLNEALKTAGLSYGDVQHVYMSYPQQAAALANGAIAASVTAEPSASQAIRLGAAVKLGVGVYPNQQVAVLLYGGDFIRKRPEVAQKFMLAYVKAARFYNDALRDGHFAGSTATELVEILMRDTNVKDKALYAEMTPNGIDPDGRPNVDSLRKDLAFFRAQKYIEGDVSVDAVLDLSFVEKAARALGPYRPAK